MKVSRDGHCRVFHSNTSVTFGEAKKERVKQKKKEKRTNTTPYQLWLTPLQVSIPNPNPIQTQTQINPNSNQSKPKPNPIQTQTQSKLKPNPNPIQTQSRLNPNPIQTQYKPKPNPNSQLIQKNKKKTIKIDANHLTYYVSTLATCTNRFSASNYPRNTTSPHHVAAQNTPLFAKITFRRKKWTDTYRTDILTPIPPRQTPFCLRLTQKPKG
jgi:hypothetical protein